MRRSLATFVLLLATGCGGGGGGSDRRTLVDSRDNYDPRSLDPALSTDVPTGLPPDVILAGKRVDLALLCVGASNDTQDAPAPTIAALSPRYVIGGHWEDFFKSADDTPSPIAFHDIPQWSQRGRNAVSLLGPEPKELVRNGKSTTTRALIADPMDTFEIPR
jgi:hypothetical protein